MEYKKIENEIDNLLHNGGLNPYERKLLRKAKRKFCADKDELKKTFDLLFFADKLLVKRNKTIEALKKSLKICYFTGVLVALVGVAEIAYCFLK